MSEKKPRLKLEQVLACLTVGRRLMTALVALSSVVALGMLASGMVLGADTRFRHNNRPWSARHRTKFTMSQDSIFFIDVAGLDGEEDDKGLGDMTLCSVESAARMNPKTRVYLLRTADLDNWLLYRPFHELKSHFPNLVFRTFDTDQILSMAGMDALLESGSLEESVWKRFHFSDVLRVALLELFGGTYLDSDAVSIKPLPEEADNFVVVERSDSIANGILRFSKGHPIPRAVAKILDEHFSPTDWAENGPAVFTRTFRRMCNIDKNDTLNSFDPKDCLGVTGFPKEKFLLIGTRQFSRFVNESTSDQIESELRQMEEKSFSSHLWGHRYNMHNITFDFQQFNSSQLIWHVGKRYCPVTFAASLAKDSSVNLVDQLSQWRRDKKEAERHI